MPSFSPLSTFSARRTAHGHLAGWKTGAPAPRRSARGCADQQGGPRGRSRAPASRPRRRSRSSAAGRSRAAGRRCSGHVGTAQPDPRCVREQDPDESDLGDELDQLGHDLEVEQVERVREHPAGCHERDRRGRAPPASADRRARTRPRSSRDGRERDGVHATDLRVDASCRSGGGGGARFRRSLAVTGVGVLRGRFLDSDSDRQHDATGRAGDSRRAYDGRDRREHAADVVGSRPPRRRPRDSARTRRPERRWPRARRSERA